VGPGLEARAPSKDPHERGCTSDRYREAAEFLRETGLRPNELAGLHRDYVDRESGWLTVAHVYDRIGKVIKPFPKDDDMRDVPLTARADEILAKWERDLPALDGCGVKHQDGRRCRSDLVFRQLNGKVMDLKNFCQIVVYAAGKAKLPPGTTPYVLRHSFGTRLANGRVGPVRDRAVDGPRDA
jgi:integrase